MHCKTKPHQIFIFLVMLLLRATPCHSVEQYRLSIFSLVLLAIFSLPVAFKSVIHLSFVYLLSFLRQDQPVSISVLLQSLLYLSNQFISWCLDMVFDLILFSLSIGLPIVICDLLNLWANALVMDRV